LGLALSIGMNFGLSVLKGLIFLPLQWQFLHLCANNPLNFQRSFNLVGPQKALMEVGCRVISHFTEAILIPKPHFLGKKSELHTHTNYMKTMK